MPRLNARRLHAEGRALSPAEQVVFNAFADEASAIGRLLAAGGSLRLEGCAPFDLTTASAIEFLVLSMRTAAKQHLQRGEDLLRLVERTGAMIHTTRPGGGQVDVGLHLVRAIAMAEILHGEAHGRFSRHEPLRALADSAMQALVAGFLPRFGGNLPGDLRRAFPAFAAAVRDSWRPVQARRGLLLWLANRS